MSFGFWPSDLAALVLGYVCGSIPFGLLLTRWAGAGDVRAIGSGNIGATNVLRTGRRDLAAATLVLDALKGTFAVLVASYAFSRDAALAAAIGAFLGHVFPIWLGFKGGKGVATFLGCLIGIAWPAALVFAAVNRSLIAQDVSRAKRAAIIDRMAAAYILQGALDRLADLAGASAPPLTG